MMISATAQYHYRVERLISPKLVLGIVMEGGGHHADQASCATGRLVFVYKVICRLGASLSKRKSEYCFIVLSCACYLNHAKAGDDTTAGVRRLRGLCGWLNVRRYMNSLYLSAGWYQHYQNQRNIPTKPAVA